MAGEIVYVGQTINLTKRIGRHLEAGKAFDSYAIVECDKRDLLSLEMSYINEFKPRHNIMGNVGDIPPE